ncbi:MAG: GNAT family N-acetyltransferase [Chloroflexi bacterium]|nr:GNAT family N-acetyltransferase [Chloroflexota bacterium]
MASENVTLRNGERMQIEPLVPPMDTFGGRVRTWEPLQDDLFSGALAETLYTPYFVGVIDGDYAGSLGYYVPVDTRDVGIVEFVATEDRHRRKGVADALMSRMLQEFVANGGQALHLCTTNPVAGHLYENHGFWYRVGDGMRFTVADADDFDATYLAFDGDPVVRDAVWGDLPRAAILYNMREPAWLLKEVLDDCLRDTRYEYHFARLKLRVENVQGAMLVLATPTNRVVGQTVFVRRDTFPQQHVATLSLRVAPAYMDHAVTLLRAAADRAREIGVSVLEFPIAATDDDLAAIAGAAGFTEAARLPNRIRDGDAWVDLCLFELALEPPARAFHESKTYYANRHPWHVERIASGPETRST